MPKLTTHFVETNVALSEDGVITYIRDSELTGFGLRVTSGVKSYFAEMKVQGRTRRVTLGRHPLISAEDARKQALVILGKMAQGVDPVAEKEKQRIVTLTLGQAFDEYMSALELTQACRMRLLLARVGAFVEFTAGSRVAEP